MFKNILVPLDGSFVGETALPYASALAERTGASLTLVRATQLPIGVGDRSVEYTRCIAEAEQYLSAQAVDLTARGFAVQTGVPFGGSPAAWITEEVAIRHADLIVHGDARSFGSESVVARERRRGRREPRGCPSPVGPGYGRRAPYGAPGRAAPEVDRAT